MGNCFKKSHEICNYINCGIQIFIYFSENSRKNPTKYVITKIWDQKIMYFSEIKDSKMRSSSHDLFSNLFPKKETFSENSGKIRKNPEIRDVITCNYIRLHKLWDKITSTRNTGRAQKLFLVFSLRNPIFM